jgi:ketol-acid reductoisomerase
MFYDDDADLSIIQGRKVGVIGYGSQGHAHSLSLRDSGVQVKVGLKEGSKSRDKVTEQGLEVDTPAGGAGGLTGYTAGARHAQADIFRNDIEPNWDGNAPFSPRPQHPFRDQAAGERHRRHGRAEGPRGMVRRQFVDAACRLIAVDQIKGEGEALACPTPRATGGAGAGVISSHLRRDRDRPVR